MSCQLVNEMKLQEVQNKLQGFEADAFGEFCFFLGDLNYRLMTTFGELNNENVSKDAIGMIPTHD